jgi:hypothetical protein
LRSGRNGRRPPRRSDLRTPQPLQSFPSEECESAFGVSQHSVKEGLSPRRACSVRCASRGPLASQPCVLQLGVRQRCPDLKQREQCEVEWEPPSAPGAQPMGSENRQLLSNPRHVARSVVRYRQPHVADLGVRAFPDSTVPPCIAPVAEVLSARAVAARTDPWPGASIRSTRTALWLSTFHVASFVFSCSPVGSRAPFVRLAGRSWNMPRTQVWSLGDLS